MKKALFLLILAALLGVGLRYVFPKEMLFASEQEKKHVDELLAETLKEVEEQKDTLEKAQKMVIEDSIIPLKKKEKQRSAAKDKPEKSQEEVQSNSFFEKLQQLETKKKGQVRIACFGDSMFDADMLIMQFRHYMQRRFGGIGVGFVPITSPSASGRYSVKHFFAANWQKQSFLKKRKTEFPYGINGETFYAGDSLVVDSVWVVYKRGTAYHNMPLVNPILFYGMRQFTDSTMQEAPKLKIMTEEAEQILPLAFSREVNMLQLPNYQKEMKLTITDQATLPLFGVSFASETGIIVDNLATRGNSGLPLTRLRTNIMRQFNQYFQYDLIILSFGTNVFSPDYEKGYSWYAKRMERVILHLRRCFPKAEILVVSMADRAVKVADEMQTPDGLPEFIALQRKLAKRTNSMFYSIFEAMGGSGSMKEWAEAEPALANKDYTHFNSKGAEKVAQQFYNWLMKKYEGYVKEHTEITEVPNTQPRATTVTIEN